MIVAEIEQKLVTETFPQWEKQLGEPLTDKLKQVIRLLAIVQIEEHIPAVRRTGRGRFPHDRRLIAHAFVVKAAYNAPTTQALWEMLHTQPMLRRICGFETRKMVPSKSTFSRSFTAFAKDNLGDKIHRSLIGSYIGDRLIGHIGRDSTEIVAREKPTKKAKREPKPKRKRGRPRREEIVLPPEPSRLQKQREQTIEEAFKELPTLCDVGCKRDTKGYSHCWVGYKSHIDTADGGLPINVVTTSASLHDSQVAIPMMLQTAERVTSLYDLMDSAYDATPIREVSLELGHQPLIDRNRRRAEAIPFAPAEAERYKQRSVCERVNSRLKDEFGGRQVRVRGKDKVHLHILFGILALFADQLFKIALW